MRHIVINSLFIFVLLAIYSCQNDSVVTPKVAYQKKSETYERQENPPLFRDTIIRSKVHTRNLIICHLDSDQLIDSVLIVQNTNNQKYGLKIIFGNREIHYLGMGQDFINQGFDDINWVGIFRKVPRGEVYWRNVNDDGEIIGEEEVNNSDKIKLTNDGIFIHQAESCGGGIVYWKNGEFKWIQQE